MGIIENINIVIIVILDFIFFSAFERVIAVKINIAGITGSK